MLKTSLLLLAVLAAAGTIAALAANKGHSSASGSPLCPQRFGSFSAGYWPPACWRPYSDRSPFNVRIPSNPHLAGDSGAVSAYIRDKHWTFENDAGRFVWDEGGSRPVYWARASDPVVSVSCTGDRSCRHGLRLHIPAGARPQGEGDGHMTVVDQPARREYDFYQASGVHGGHMTVTAGRPIAIGAGLGSGRGGDAEAAYLGLLGGLIRAPELAAGRIEHALAMTAPCEQSRDVWPAPANGRADSTCPRSGAGPHFASLLQLNMSDAQIAATHAPRWQRAIMTAMAHYGIYVVDTGGSGGHEMSLLFEDDLSYTAFGAEGAMKRFVRSAGGAREHHLTGVPLDATKLRVIAPCVPRGTC
jgi:hypothetical protein